MPRSVEISVPPDDRNELLARLSRAKGVAAILVHAGAGHHPPGDIVVVHGTNDSAEAAIRAAGELGLVDRGCIMIGQPVGLVSGPRGDEIGRDSNVSSWEEILTLLRRDSNPSHNYLGMMALAGALASVGLYTDTLPLVIAAMLVAPGFESLVRISVGLASGSLGTLQMAFIAVLSGYLALVIGAAVAMPLAALASPGETPVLAEQHWIGYWTEVGWLPALTAILAGFAGAIVVNSHQTVFATGVVVALALIPAMAATGLALAAGELTLAGQAITRWCADAACVLAASLAVFGAKRAVGRRGVYL